ncbi:hypothetical protein DW103_01400 [Parabacteroides sp. AM08-6]|nr:hypothetical protein DW103_01400 [Parabacteroides sp. AM08-6]
MGTSGNAILVYKYFIFCLGHFSTENTYIAVQMLKYHEKSYVISIFASCIMQFNDCMQFS